MMKSAAVCTSFLAAPRTIQWYVCSEHTTVAYMTVIVAAVIKPWMYLLIGESGVGKVGSIVAMSQCVPGLFLVVPS
eukprot:1158529-Pelagomonas_calceolata.AAC.8